jgi:hypothetical protein
MASKIAGKNAYFAKKPCKQDDFWYDIIACAGMALVFLP